MAEGEIRHQTRTRQSSTPSSNARIRRTSGRGSSARGADHNGLGTCVLARKLGRPFIEKQGDDFREISVKFLEGLALTVGTGISRDIANVEPRIRATLHDRGKGVHRFEDPSSIQRAIPASATDRDNATKSEVGRSHEETTTRCLTPGFRSRSPPPAEKISETW